MEGLVQFDSAMHVRPVRATVRFRTASSAALELTKGAVLAGVGGAALRRPGGWGGTVAAWESSVENRPCCNNLKKRPPLHLRLRHLRPSKMQTCSGAVP